MEKEGIITIIIININNIFLVNREGLLGKMVIGDCLGHSDQVVKFEIFSDRKTATKTSTVNSGRADFRQLRELVSDVPW